MGTGPSSSTPEGVVDDGDCFLAGSSPTSAICRAGTTRPLRILCLHGKGSSNAVTQMQVSHISLSSSAHCDFLNGPVPDKPFSPVVEEFFGGNFWQWHIGVNWASVQLALQRVLKYVEENGPYDGVYGFSQGAGIATVLSRPSVRKAMGRESPLWKFVITACGVDRVGVPADMPMGAEKNGDDPQSLIDLPSLHLIGRWDMLRFLSSSMTKSYADGEGPRRVVHYMDVGHELPMNLLRDEALQNAVVSFLRKNANADA